MSPESTPGLVEIEPVVVRVARSVRDRWT